MAQEFPKELPKNSIEILILITVGVPEILNEFLKELPNEFLKSSEEIPEGFLTYIK